VVQRKNNRDQGTAPRQVQDVSERGAGAGQGELGRDRTSYQYHRSLLSLSRRLTRLPSGGGSAEA